MPKARTAKSLKLMEAMYDILQVIQPASVRAVCYQLFTQGLLESMAKKHTDKVSRLLTQAREEELIPWEWIVDETRHTERAQSWDDPEQYADAVIRSYRRDYWVHQPCHVEVWSEKGTVRGTLKPVLDKYGIGFRVQHGFGSATSLHDAALESQYVRKPFIVLYAGDWDPSGLCMSELDIPKRLARYAGAVTMRRIALIAADVGAGTTLPDFAAETKKQDTRYTWFCNTYGSRCWELDALNPRDLRDRVDAAIEAYIEPSAWERCQVTEHAERESLTSIIGNWAALRS